MNALGVAQPHSDATDVTSWRSASNTSACCRRSWVRHCGNVIPSSSLNRRLSVRALADTDPAADLLQRQGLGQVVGDQRARVPQPAIGW